MDGCIFCAIGAHQSPAEIEYDDEEVVAFRDINPKAPVHIVIIPKKHVASLTELQEEDAALAGKMILVAKHLAEEKGISEDGYRLVINAGKHSGQVVDHIHLHLLGGKILGDIA